MYDYSYVLGLLHVHAVDHRSHALSGKEAEIENRTTERTLRNRARLICERLLDMSEPQRRQFAERAVRHL
ncbi:MAG TPA: hypothetical protein VKQ73_10490 [Stellaceae bacterium]|nr:hypothetical protein [Stellaceae bacterium]